MVLIGFKPVVGRGINLDRQLETMSELSSRVCTACRGDADKLGEDETLEMIQDLHEDWDIENNHHLGRSFDFEDFSSALKFVNKIGEVAEEQGHHPDIYLSWGEVEVKLYTHKIDGLHDNDFIMAARIDELYES